ncbi:MAG: AAA family ATPase [Cyclobacteriaceae bacterium]
MEKNNANPNRRSLKKIVLIGPESTGKTTLARKLAKHYGTTWVPEYAREFLNALDRPYQKSDLLEIAKGQLEQEDEATSSAKGILICDTNLWVLKVWSEYKYGSCHSWIEEQINQRFYDYYLLTNIDIVWQADPQREHPDQREGLFQIYHQHLSNQAVPFEILNGNLEVRFQRAITLIDSLV